MSCKLYQFSDLNSAQPFLQTLSKRNDDDNSVEAQVIEIINNVREHGDKALTEYTKKFDHKESTGLFKISAETIHNSVNEIPSEDYEILENAAQQIYEFHEMQKEKSWFHTKEDGTILGQKVEPINRAGIYVPGGRGGNTPLISSLLMGAIPALVAGVSEIAIVSPPRADGTLNPYILAAAHLLDIEEVYAVGGAWAIAALAYGTQSIKSVDIITGPGNAFVTTAKRLAHGHVAIDMIAGPSEILIIADEKANPNVIAADMLSQAEHDTLASAVLVTDCESLAKEVADCLAKRVELLPRKDIAKESLKNWSGLVVFPNMEMCIDFANQVASEHLEVLCEDSWSFVPRIKHAGAIFLGAYSAEVVGDYFAGPNHVLPTMSTARFASGLSTQTFTKKTNILSISESYMKKNAKSIARFARLESLEAHAQAAEVREEI